MVHFALIQLTKKHTEIFGIFLEIILNNQWDITIYYNVNADEYSFVPYYINLFEKNIKIKATKYLIEDKDLFDYFIWTSSSDDNYIHECFKTDKYANKSIYIQHQSVHCKEYMYKNIVVSPVIQLDHLKAQKSYLLPIYKNYKQMHYSPTANQPIIFGIVGAIRGLNNGKTLDRDLGIIKRTIEKFPNENYEFHFFMRKWDWIWICNKNSFLTQLPKIKSFSGLKTPELIEKLRGVKYILPIAKKNGWFYWQRLTGSIPLAINLNIPLIIDRQLAKIYGMEEYSILYKDNLTEIFQNVMNMDDSTYQEYILKNVKYKKNICKQNEENFRNICLCHTQSGET